MPQVQTVVSIAQDQTTKKRRQQKEKTENTKSYREKQDTGKRRRRHEAIFGHAQAHEGYVLTRHASKRLRGTWIRLTSGKEEPVSGTNRFAKENLCVLNV
jgi:hypothetical protein